MASHKEIEDRAAAWLAKRDSGNWSAEDETDLACWLRESVACRVAFLRLEAVWDETRRLKVFGAGRVPGIVPMPGQWRSTPFFDANLQPSGTHGAEAPSKLAVPPEIGSSTAEAGPREAGQFQPILEVDTAASLECPPSTRRRARSGRRSLALAASLLLAIGIGGYIALVPAADRYSTPIGGMESVPLRDGSNMTLNTASSVRVNLTPSERLIDLQQGEVFFKVAKDPTRPFVVRVGNKRVVAVGTQFSVRRDGDDIRVVVTEGTVRLESANTALSGGTGSGLKRTVGSSESAGVRPADGNGSSVTPVSTSLPAGTIARATEEDVLIDKEPVSQAEELLSWRQGYLRFHDTTLAAAIAEFNRYNARRIMIDDPRVAAIRISGTFRPANYEAFVRLLGDGYSIRAEDKGDLILLTKN